MKHKVSVSKCLVRGESLWRVRWHELGRVRRKFFTGRDSAEAHAATLRGGQVTLRQQFSAMDPGEQEKLMAVWNEAQRRGLNLFAALARVDAATAGQSVPIGDLIAEMVAVKRNSGLSERYLKVLELILNQFARGRERLPIDAFALADVERYLDSHNAASRQCLRGRVSTLFRFAIRRGYRTSNPCDQLEPMKVPHRPPPVLTVKQAASCVGWLKDNPRSLAWFVLSAFAGLRPEEADNTKWADIHFAERWIRVDAQTSKVRQRRVVYPLPMVFDWLARAKRLKSKLPIYRVTRTWDLKRLREVLGFKVWPKDITRHSAASYWLAASGSASDVATALGHSESVLRRHYMALVTKADAARYWALRP